MLDYKGYGYVKVLAINPPTDREIEKVLHGIVNKEGANCQNVAMNKF